MIDKTREIQIVRDADSTKRVPDQLNGDHAPSFVTYSVQYIYAGTSYTIGYVNGFNAHEPNDAPGTIDDGQWLVYREDGGIAKACSDGYCWYEETAAEAALWLMQLDEIREGVKVLRDDTLASSAYQQGPSPHATA